jgi:hypothetical protein
LKYGPLILSVLSQKEKKGQGEKYIITVIEYLTKWAEAEPVENCTKETTAKFIYKNIVTRFGCPFDNNQVIKEPTSSIVQLKYC